MMEAENATEKSCVSNTHQTMDDGQCNYLISYQPCSNH